MDMKLTELLSLADRRRDLQLMEHGQKGPLFAPGGKEKFLSLLGSHLKGADGEAAFAFLSSKAGGELFLTEEDVKTLASIAGGTSSDKRAAGEPSGRAGVSYRSLPLRQKEAGFPAAAPEDLPHLMRHFSDQILSSRFTLHPIELAAMGLKRLIDISPFESGNEGTAVLLAALILVNAGFPPFFITDENRASVKEALAVSRKTCDIEPLCLLVAGWILKEGF